MELAAAIAPKEFAFHSNLGNTYVALGRIDDALRCFRSAIQLRPLMPELHCNLGSAHSQARNYPAAEASYRRALELREEYPDAWNGLGVALLSTARFAESEQAFRTATQHRPGYAAAHNNLGNALAAQGKKHEAIAAYKEAVATDPNYVEALSNLGNALREAQSYDEALASYRRALELRPGFAVARNNLATTLQLLGRMGEAVAEYRRALQSDPKFLRAEANLVLAMQSDDATETDALFEAHKKLGKKIEDAIFPLSPRKVDVSPDRRLRLGFVSSDLRRHSVAFFLEPLLAHLDRSQFELFAYHAHAHEDATSDQLRAHFASWLNVATLSDEQLAKQVRADGVDVLIDLGGHTSESRLLTFSYKPAPVSVTWLGYPDTTGMTRIDARFTDLVADPAGAPARATERLIRLEGPFLCYGPAKESPSPSSPPFEEKGFVTFGTFNALHKVTPAGLEQFLRILQEVPRSRLVLKSNAFGSVSTSMRLRAYFEAEGIESERLSFLPWIESNEGHLAAYHQLDIALDTFPYNGATTTCEALWMGVPTITQAGERHASRVSASILRAAGLQELVAEDAASYVRLAVDLANNPSKLKAMRTELRGRVSVSPLCDGRAFAATFGAAIRGLWTDYARAHSL